MLIILFVTENIFNNLIVKLKGTCLFRLHEKVNHIPLQKFTLSIKTQYYTIITVKCTL